MVLKNQHQSANLAALSPVRSPTSPIREHVYRSSAMAFTSSRRTGGGVCIKAWMKGRVFCFTVWFDVDSDEYGTDC